MISVVMSVYNAEKYLRFSIESILNQTYTDFEFIIINDCSEDDSLKIINEYSKNDSRIITVNNDTNLGLTRNLNKGLTIARGEYIARMDADDISILDRFEKQMCYFQKNEHIDILGGFCVDIDESGKVIRKRKAPLSHKEIISSIYKVNPIYHPTVIFKKQKIANIGFYNEEYKVVQDYDLWFRSIANNLIIQNLPDILLKYRINDNYYARKSFNYRLIDFKIRYRGYKSIGVSWYKWGYLFVPLILGVTPNFLYKLLKKLDPR